MIASEIMELREELADAYEGLAWKLINSITDEDIQKINAYQRTIAFCMATDKIRLLRNESTENISMEALHIRDEDIERRRIAAEERLSKLTGVVYETERIKLREIILKEQGKVLKQNYKN